MRRLGAVVFLAITALAVVPGRVGAEAVDKLPDLGTHAVVDTTKALRSSTIDQVDADLRDYKNRTGNEIAVVIVKTTGNDSIEDFAADAYHKKYKLGQSGKDNGALMVIATQDRHARIEVGYGLEGVLTDTRAKKVIDDYVVPNMKNNDPNAAVTSGERAIRVELNDASASSPAPVSSTDKSHSSKWGWLVFVIILVIAGMVSRVFGRGSGWGSGSGLIFGSGIGWGAGGWGGGGDGFGGFSSGGGDSGGGGASGSW